jgi:phospholipase C
VWGEWATAQALNALLLNAGVWETSALLVTYDENGGFFDHVPPPTAPAGTPGEYITVPLSTVPGAGNVAGPIGLGFRVPMLVISPFSRGGFVAAETFDHTSTLKLLAARFAAEGVTVPNLSAWRDATVGDMTSAFNFAKLDSSVPSGVSSVAAQPSLLDPRVTGSDCTTSGPASEYSETGPGVQYTPVVVNSSAPGQERGGARTPSGPVTCAA